MSIRLFILLWGLLLASIGAAEPEQGDQAQLRIQQQKRQQLQQSIAVLQKSIRKTRREKDSLSAELADSEREIGSLIVQLRQLDAQQLLLQANLRNLQREQKELQRHLAATRNKLAQLLRSAYMAGRQERLKLFLNQQDPALLSRLLTYHDYISRERMRRLQLLSQDMKKNRSLAIQIEQQQMSLNQSREQQQTKKENLQQRQAQRRRLLQQVDSRLQQQDQKLARWQEDERQLANLLKDLRHSFRELNLPEQKGFQESRGKLIWPLSGKLLKGFGAHKIGNLRWDGVIIGAREGEEVRTVHAGRVAWADWLRGYGLLIIVEHGDGFMSLYGNNQSLFKETGDWVEAGEVIAQASGGDKRNTSGIYFGIRYQGKALNPERWCRKSHRG